MSEIARWAAPPAALAAMVRVTWRQMALEIVCRAAPPAVIASEVCVVSRRMVLEIASRAVPPAAFAVLGDGVGGFAR